MSEPTTPMQVFAQSAGRLRDSILDRVAVHEQNRAEFAVMDTSAVTAETLRQLAMKMSHYEAGILMTFAHCADYLSEADDSERETIQSW